MGEKYTEERAERELIREKDEYRENKAKEAKS
jgi:hypothetical protein